MQSVTAIRNGGTVSIIGFVAGVRTSLCSPLPPNSPDLARMRSKEM